MSGRSASLAMYSIAPLRPSYERMWQAVVALVPDLPATLTWPDDLHASWTDRSVVLKQTCGWPLVTRLGRSVTVIGAFAHDVSTAENHRYRSVIIATRPGQADDFASAAVAYNSTGSLSGWVSLMAWTGRTDASLRSTGVETGAHAASLETLRSGNAEVTSIDSVTLAHIRRHQPGVVAGLHEVGHGPLVPTLPIVAPADAGDDFVRLVRTALAAVVDDRALAATMRELLITGFVPLDFEDYVRDLEQLELNR